MSVTVVQHAGDQVGPRTAAIFSNIVRQTSCLTDAWVWWIHGAPFTWCNFNPSIG